MAIDTSSGIKPVGSIGDFNFYEQDGRTIVRQKASPQGNQRRTPRRMLQRIKMDNVVAAWQSTMGHLDSLFEKEKPGQSAYNRFVSLNLKEARVYLTEEERRNKACVLDRFTVADGSLGIEIEAEERDGWMVSSLSLGGEELTPETSVARLFFLLNCNNTFRFLDGDRLHFVRMTQKERNGLGQPDVETEYGCIELGVHNRHPLYGMVYPDQFAMHDGYLAAPARENSMVAWALTREDKKRKRHQCSHAVLSGSNSLLERYTSDEAIREALKSYKVKVKYNEQFND